MTDHQQRSFTIGAEVACSDGVAGTVMRVVIDPIALAVTHLVVERRHDHEHARLVPLGLLEGGDEPLRLGCTLAAFDALEPAEETHFLPSVNGGTDYPAGAALVWPYYGLGLGYAGGMAMDSGTFSGPPPHPVTTDVVPAGEVVVNRGQRVHAVDGEIGRVQGVVIGEPGHRITHVLLQEGHLFGRKQVAIPVDAIDDVAEGITLTLTKHEVEALPDVDLHSYGDQVVGREQV